MLARLFFKLGHALHFANVGKAVQNPGELAMGRDEALPVEVRIGVGEVQPCCHKIFKIMERISI